MFMPKKIIPASPRLTIRLSVDERSDLESRADRLGLSMGGYCKSVIFNAPPPKASRRPARDKAELARLLGQVSKLGNNVNQIAKRLHVTSSLDQPRLREAINDLHVIRAAIMNALGYQDAEIDVLNPDSGQLSPEQLHKQFSHASHHFDDDEVWRDY
jgi:hypothetical protein